jgi:hypothetical protein
VACESAAHEHAELLLAQTESVRNAGLEICRVRYYLRTRQLVKAEEAGLRLCQTPAARLAWPYLSLIWRLRGDARADWLDGVPPYITSYDLGFSSAELGELASLLRQLHTASVPYIEQSVRGGTQTDRPLFFRHEPIILATKSKIVAAVNEYVAALPDPDAALPDAARLGLPLAGWISFGTPPAGAVPIDHVALDHAHFRWRASGSGS